MIYNTNSQEKSVLIIGASGALGLQCLRHTARDSSIAKVHVFCRTPSKLSDSDKMLCESIITGDARNADDIEKALIRSKANYVILATGNGLNFSKTDVRQKTGEALAQVLRKSVFHHVKAIVMSSNGAGGSKIKVGMGVGSMIAFYIRHVNRDHTKQENAFEDIASRTLIVRPTALTDGKEGGILVEFGDKVKGPTINADRSDVAAWVTKEIAQKSFRARKVNLTSAK